MDEAKAGDDVLVLLDQTAFYAQSGGQVGDNGVIESADGTAKIAVSDCRYGSLKRHIHYGKVESGSFKTGQTVISEVNKADRMATARNHTATHMLQKALKQVKVAQLLPQLSTIAATNSTSNSRFEAL